MQKIFIIKERDSQTISLRDDYRQALQCALKKCQRTKATIEVWERLTNSNHDDKAKPVAVMQLSSDVVVTILKDENPHPERYEDRCFELNLD